MGDDILVPEIRLEHWMGDLPRQLKEIPLIYLAIPGSHDSMTYGITKDSGLAPDAEPALRTLYPLFRGTILRWTVTQANDTWQQLLMGIRYFDLRLATKVGEENFYFTHGLYADEISKALNQIKEFVDTHPEEVVILDCQHFYGFSDQDHQRLIRYLVNLYGNRLAPRMLDHIVLTIDALNRLNMKVLIVYRNAAANSASQLWHGTLLPSPWPRSHAAQALRDFLRHVYRGRHTGFVHQAVLTPTPLFIVLRFTSNLREKCAIPVVNEVLPMLKEFTPGPPGVNTYPSPINVVIADFVDIDSAIFPKTIIELNWKLLKSLEQKPQ